MNFERHKNPYKSLRIGSGRAKRLFLVSMGGGARMDDKGIIAMIKHWQHTKTAPDGMYLLVERNDETKHFVKPINFASGELIEWKEKTYLLP